MALSLSVLIVLAGCDNNYPAGWARVDHAWLASCPDVSGTYLIGSNNAEGVGRDSGMSDTLFRGILPPRTAQRWHWETMTIAGDPAQQLDITLMHSPQTMENYHQYLFAQGGKDYYKNKFNNMHSPVTRWSGSFASMTDDEFEANLDKLYLAPVQHRSLKNGKDYECAGGWITGERLVSDPGPDRNSPRPDFMDGIVRFGKDKSGFLVAESIYRQEQQFNVWCGDGCKGFSLGTWTMHDWRHWESAQPAWHGEREKAWAEPFNRDNTISTGNNYESTLRLVEVRNLVTPAIQPPLSLVDLVPTGKDMVLLVNSPTTEGFNKMFQVLSRVFTFYDIRVQELVRKPEGGWSMRVLLVLRPRQ